MQQITSARPQPDTRIHGCYEITAQITVDGGYSINTQTATGGTRIPELCIATADRDTYRLAYAVIREGGINQVHPDGVRAALTDALVRDLAEVQRRRDTPSKNRVEHINALLDRLESPVERAELDALAADINRTLGRSIDETVPAGSTPQVARSRTGVEHKPLSPAMQRAVNAQLHGIIYPRDGVTRATLRALARRGFGILHYASQRKLICSLELNKQGHAAAVRAVA
jgi:hypothetical protein